MKKVNYLCFLIFILTLITTLMGIFYTTGENSFSVVNIYGESIELYGNGIYKYNSILKSGANKGTDLVMLIIGMCLFFFTVMKNKNKKQTIYKYLEIGCLSGIFYYSSCLVFGVTFNRLFLIYVLLFSSSLFALIFLLVNLFKDNELNAKVIGKKLNGTALFIMICGSSTLIWLEFILPSIFTENHLSIIEIYTTEITFVLDLGIVLPLYWGCGIALFMKKEIGYKLTPILLMFIVIVGMTVIGQNIFQSSMGIDIPIRQLFGLVISFVCLAVIAIILNIRFFRFLK